MLECVSAQPMAGESPVFIRVGMKRNQYSVNGSMNSIHGKAAQTGYEFMIFLNSVIKSPLQEGSGNDPDWEVVALLDHLL